jgi:hypothetical protein
MSKVGRPSRYDANMAAEICGRIAAGESLAAICRDPLMPVQTTVYRWIATIPEFQQLYTCAREDQAETLADQIQDIADEMPVMVAEDGKAPRVDNGWVTWQRNRVDARKWIASKLKAKKYGDKVTNQHEGGVTLQVLTGVPTE